MECRKMVLINLFAGSNGDADTENRLVDTGVGEGEDEMNGESSMETYTLPYVKQIASGNLLHNRGGSNQWWSGTT